MICPKCGKNIDKDSQFCEYCGEQIKVTNTQPVKNKTRLFLVVIAVLLILLCGSLFYAYQMGIDAMVLRGRLNDSRVKQENLNAQLTELRKELNENEKQSNLVNTVAIISADMMNVFYVGIHNPISVSVPGVPAQNVQVSVSNGSLIRTAKGWSVRPTKAGVDCKISVSAKSDNGTIQNIGTKSYRVKLLPSPIACIEYNSDGYVAKYKGSRPISRQSLISAVRVKAELDDADLNVSYQVLGFDLCFYDSMGNSLARTSSSGNFTTEQLDIIRKTSKGKKLYITRVRAKGPDGVEKILSPIEVIIN